MSVIRILLIPVFAVLFLQEHYFIAIAVIIFAELTDLFDGMIARKFNQVSALGKILDPIADKLSQISIIVVLIVKYWDNAIKYLFMFFIIKEIIMLIGGAILISKGLRPVAAEMWGKVATTVFCIVMIFVLAFGEGGAGVKGSCPVEGGNIAVLGGAGHRGPLNVRKVEGDAIFLGGLGVVVGVVAIQAGKLLGFLQLVRVAGGPALFNLDGGLVQGQDAGKTALMVFHRGLQQRENFIQLVRLGIHGQGLGNGPAFHIPRQVLAKDVRNLVSSTSPGQIPLEERLGVCVLRHKEGFDQQ